MSIAQPNPPNLSEAVVPRIHRLTIERFRGIVKLVWRPAPGLNVIIGGGDIGKSTILDAIALLLTPSTTTVLSEWDYWMREPEQGFRIEAVMSLPTVVGIHSQSKPAFPWLWNDDSLKQPPIDEEDDSAGEPVFVLQVRGTPEFDLVYELMTPSDKPENLSPALRRGIGLVRLSGDDRNERDLRLVYGSPLDRLLGDRTLRSRLGRHMATAMNVRGELQLDGKEALARLARTLRESALPGDLDIGFTGAQGISLGSLIGLLARKRTPDANAMVEPPSIPAAGSAREQPAQLGQAHEEQLAHPEQPEAAAAEHVLLPMATWGSGTRRLAALTIAAANQNSAPVVVVDEVERGLEPYRQRTLVGTLQGQPSQVFLTTHSAAALSAASTAAIWYMGSPSTVGRVSHELNALRSRDPEALLARLTIMAEGATEAGFVSNLLERAFDGEPLMHGVWVADGEGNEQTLALLTALAASGLKFGGFADNEGVSPTRWASLKAKLGPLLFQWHTGCLESNLIPLVTLDRLEEFIADEDGVSGERRRTLQERAGTPDKAFETLKHAVPDLHSLIVQAATGYIPDELKDASKKEQRKTFKKHQFHWFKSVAGGHELANKAFAFGLWPSLEATLMPFLNAVRTAVGLSPLSALPLRS